MATYPPPSFFSNIFDTNAFSHGNDNAGLTEAEADLLYYQYPVGQAFQTLQQTDHIGLATFNAGIDINTGTLKFPDNTIQTTAASGTNILPLNNVFTGTNEFQSTVQFNSALIVSNGTQNTSLGNGFLPLAVGQGTQNVFVGVGAGLNALCGSGNTVCGYFSASQGMTSASNYNTLYGERAGQYLTSGVGNTLIGATNCNNVSTGNSNICLGYGAMAGESSGSFSNNIVIGNGIQSGASNRIILGDGTQTSMDLKVVSGSTVNMGGKLNMNDATIADRHVSATVFSIQEYTTGVISGEIKHQSGGVIIDSAGNGGTIKAYCKDGIGTQFIPLTISTSSIQLLTSAPLKFGNATEQITAYTGGTAGTYTNTDITIDANGKISAIASGAGPTPVNPQTWGLTTGNIANAGGQLVGGIRYVNYNYYTANHSPVQMGAVARFEFTYSVYGVKSASSGNYTLASIDQCGGTSFPAVSNPNTITTFDLNLGYLLIGAHSTQYITNVQTTSNYWNALQTYYPKNAPTTPYTFQPLTLTGNATVSNPKQLLFTIGFPQNISIGGNNALGDMSCGCASLRIISSPPSTADEVSPYSSDTLGSLSAGSWYFS